MRNCNDVVVLGGNHYNTLWVVRSLGKQGYSPTVIVVDGISHASFVCKSKYVKQAYVVPSEQDMIELLLSLDFREQIPLFASSDRAADAVDRQYDRLKSKYYMPNCADTQGELSAWMDKKRMTSLAREVGFNVPYTMELNLMEDEISVEDIPLPCVLKPLKSSEGSKMDFRVCRNQAELLSSLDNLRQHCPEILLQEYLKPEFEISILGMRNRRAGVHLVPGLLHKVGTCQSVHNMGMPTYAFVESSIEPYISMNQVAPFIETIDYDGLYSIEFFVSKGKAYFLEINLRVDGDLFVYTQAGVNMPVIWSALSKDEVVPPSAYLLKKERTYGMTEISYLKYMDFSKPLKVLKDWWKTDCYSIFSWTDIKPFLYKFIYSI